MKNKYLPSEIDRLEEVTKEVNQWFGGLSESQLNWKPAPDKWSIAQVLDHLIIFNRLYFDLFSKIENKEHRQPLTRFLPFLPKVMGKLLLNSMEKDGQKFKAPKKISPEQSNIAEDIVQRFENSQMELLELITKTDGIKHSSYVVASPVMRSINYTLQDNIKILAAHEERHLRQAKRVFEQEKFPKKV